MVISIKIIHGRSRLYRWVSSCPMIDKDVISINWCFVGWPINYGKFHASSTSFRTDVHVVISNSYPTQLYIFYLEGYLSIITFILFFLFSHLRNMIHFIKDNQDVELYSINRWVSLKAKTFVINISIKLFAFLPY